MTRDELQKMIDGAGEDAGNMRRIGESYLRGDVIHDLVAADGWLMKAIAQEDPVESVWAMEIMAREILGKETSISDEDYRDMKRDWMQAAGKRKAELGELLQLSDKMDGNPYEK